MKSPGTRVLLDILTFVCILVLPWWISVVILVALAVYFPLYLELLFFAFIIDGMYGTRYPFPYVALIVSFVFLCILVFVKSKIRR